MKTNPHTLYYVYTLYTIYRLITTILASPDSFYQGNKESNPWHSGGGDGGGCCIIS